MRAAQVATAAGVELGDPFTPGGAEALLAWASGPAPRGARGGVNRYLFLAYGERADLAEAYPDLDGADGAGLAGWAQNTGRREAGLPVSVIPPGGPAIGEEPPPPRPAPPRPRRRSTSSATWPESLGVGEAARLYVRGLEAAGASVRTTTPAPAPAASPPYGRIDFAERRNGDEPADINLICLNADELPSFVAASGAACGRGGGRSGVWAWETDVVPERWEAAYAQLDEIWVYSRFVAENLGRVAPVPVVPCRPRSSRPDSRWHAERGSSSPRGSASCSCSTSSRRSSARTRPA